LLAPNFFFFFKPKQLDREANASNFRPMKLFSRTGSTGAMFQKLEDRTLLSSWYVSTSGSDTASGSLTAPFRTIQHAANIAEPGDTVLIRAGVYHETVVPAHSGTSSKPITYEPYKDESVTIDGADTITGWTLYKGSVYEAKVPWDLGTGNNQLFVDGVMVNEARFPNTGTDLSHPVLGSAASTSVHSNGSNSTATLYDPKLTQPTNSWVGATIHFLAGQAWYMQSGTITASKPGQVTFSFDELNSSQIPAKGNKFFITGKLQALDSAGEWYHDPNTGITYLWMPQNDKSPTGHTIEVKHRQLAMDLSGRSYITVQGLSIFSSRIFSDNYSSHLVIDNLKASYVSQFGIDINGRGGPGNSTGIVLDGSDDILENSTIAFSAGNGVWLGGANQSVQNCVIHDCGYMADDTAGISAAHLPAANRGATDPNIAYNTVYNCGRDGVFISNVPRAHVMHNIIHDCMLQTTDGGCIYSFGTNGSGSEIGYNVCYNVHSGGYGASGIFFDNVSSGVNAGNYLIDHNIVFNADHALKFNPPYHGNIVVNNTFVDCTDGIASSHDENASGSIFANNIITGNIAHLTGVTFENNLLGCSTTWSSSKFTNNLMKVSNPGFVNAAADNFQLAATSMAVNKGMIWKPYTNGYMGSAPDDGALELSLTPFSSGSTLLKAVPFL
jgi:Right handed beta helix region